MAATAAPFFLSAWQPAMDYYRYVYSAGAVILLIARFIQGRSSSDLKLRRLYRLEIWEAVIFCVAAVFLFYPGAQLRDWVAFTLAGAALQAYTSIAIPARESKKN